MSDAARDPYIDYTRTFFRRWAGAYDWFAASISPAYRAAVRAADPRPDSCILDICTGTGEVALRCAARGAEVTGVDITPEMLDRARRKAQRRRLARPPAFELMDARRLRFADGAFDVVTISFALHDMPRQVRIDVLREARRVCRGRLIVLDYRLPRARIAFGVWLWAIALFESPYFRSFVRESPAVVFRAAGLPEPEMRRLWPLVFALFRFQLGAAQRS